MALARWDERVGALTQLRVANLEQPELAKADDHHLRNVLRARVGEAVVLSDGRGGWRMARVGTIGFECTSDIEHDAPLAPISIYMAPLKGDRSELAVAKCVELGVSSIVPLVCERSAVKFRGDVRIKIIDRWRRIAAEASGQCRRTWDLEVAEAVEVSDVPSDVVFADFDGTREWGELSRIAVGPEGGFTAAELAGRRSVSLGDTVLRAETAALAAATMLGARASGWGFATSTGPLG
jgi:16S rRNA (uracil1498-N3)-methyltransferase